jgi:hypothetical protein
MYRRHEVAEALGLALRGHTATEISELVGIPRRTVCDWLHSRLPRGGPEVVLCTDCGQPAHRLEDLPEVYAYLLGIYLGDGCLSAHPRGVFRLRIVLDAAYPRIIDEVAAAIDEVRPANPAARFVRYHENAAGERYPSCVEVYSYSRSWPCLFPQHGPGRKHERVIALAGWQQALVTAHPKLLLRGLIHSDGCRSINKDSGTWRQPRYSFSNVSDDIRNIFIAACDQLGLHTTTAPRTVYVSRKADVALMDAFVGPKA